MIPFDGQLLRRFWQIAGPYWFSDGRRGALGLLALLVALLFGQALFAVLLNAQTGEFTSALAAHDEARFWSSIRQCLVLLVVAVPTHAFYYYVRDTLGLRWRRWLTRDYLSAYLGNGMYYRLNASAEIDNPDQRIAEDINTFTQKSLQFLLVLASAVLQLAAFSGVLWAISRELVLFLIVYAVVGTTVTVRLFGRVLVGLNFNQLRREADFRFSLVRIREHAEAIAFYAGEARESRQVDQHFDAVYGNASRLIGAQLRLNLFQYAYSFMTIVLPSAIIAGRVLSGELEVGRAIQAAGAFAAILAALAVIVDNFESFSKFAAGIDRLDSFAGFMDGKHDATSDERIEFVEDSRIHIDGLTLWTPNRERTLICDLSLSIDPGQSLMIVGASGCGKSSLLRAIAGLWRSGHGRIGRPPATCCSCPSARTCCWAAYAASCSTPGRTRPSPTPNCWPCSSRSTCPIWWPASVASTPPRTGPRCCRWANSSGWPSPGCCWRPRATRCSTKPAAPSTWPTRTASTPCSPPPASPS